MTGPRRAPLRRTAFYPDLLALQGQVSAAAAEGMKETPMYQLYSSVAPRPEDWPKLLDKIGEFMKKDYDYSQDVAKITAPTLVVAVGNEVWVS